MPVNIGKFNPSEVEPAKAFDLLPNGWYVMQGIEAETKETSTGGWLLQIRFEMSEAHHPDLKGRRLWVRLNLGNANEQAVQIASAQLSAISRAVGVMASSDNFDAELLLRKLLAVKVGTRPAKGDYEAQNEPKGFDAMQARFPNGAAPTASAAPGAPSAPKVTAAPAQAQPAGPTGAQPPWMRKP